MQLPLEGKVGALQFLCDDLLCSPLVKTVVDEREEHFSTCIDQVSVPPPSPLLLLLSPSPSSS